MYEWINIEMWRALCWLGVALLGGYSAGRLVGWLRAEEDAKRAAAEVIAVVAEARTEEE